MQGALQMMRKDDTAERTHFRSGRLIHQMGAWYIATREGDMGPFTNRSTAETALRRFLMKHTGPELPDPGDIDAAAREQLKEEWDRLLRERALQAEFKRL
jgi:hypothetical protein